MAGHLLLGGAAVDLPAQVFVEDHQFIDAGTTAIVISDTSRYEQLGGGYAH